VPPLGLLLLALGFAAAREAPVVLDAWPARRLFHLILPTLLSLGRVPRLSNRVLSHPLYSSGAFLPCVLWCAAESLAVANAHSIRTDCPQTPPVGVTCRVAASFALFLASGYPWYFFGQDDTWPNPSNLRDLLAQLETFVDPRRDLVFKGCPYRYIYEAAYLQGGSGILLSRAAVELIVALNFTRLTEISLNHQEDTAFTLVFYKFLRATRDWSDFRFTGPGTGYRTRFVMPPVIRSHWDTRFRDFDVRCAHDVVSPLRAAVAIHTAGVPELEQLIVGARTLPEDIAMQWDGAQTYSLCRCAPGTLARLGSTEELRAATPILRRSDFADQNMETVAVCAQTLTECRYEHGSSLIK
jgi:hypothetical protein